MVARAEATFKGEAQQHQLVEIRNELTPLAVIKG